MTTVQKRQHAPPRFLIDRASDTFLDDVLEGLARQPRAIPPKYFYDGQGAHLFDKICETPEYYIARTEQAILARIGAELAERIGRGVCVIEYGANSPYAARALLARLQEPGAYVAVDTSRRQAVRTARAISAEYPEIAVAAVCTDIDGTFELPAEIADRPRLGLLPGSQIGSFGASEAQDVLSRMRGQFGPGAWLLVGVDLVKDPAVIRAAYDDSSGATAAFNLNLLGRMKRELGATVDIADFTYRANYDAGKGRVEMHLAARRETAIGVAGHVFTFASGEAIHTDNSYKYTPEGFADLAKRAGFVREGTWSDPDQMFGVELLKVA